MKNTNEQLPEAGPKYNGLLPKQIKFIQESDRDNRLNGNADATCENKFMSVISFRINIHRKKSTKRNSTINVLYANVFFLNGNY